MSDMEVRQKNVCLTKEISHTHSYINRMDIHSRILNVKGEEKQTREGK